jgi:hypothetical protein
MRTLLLGTGVVSRSAHFYPDYLLIHLAERVDLRRKPLAPRTAHTVSIANNAPQTMRPVRYETTI